MLNAFLADMTVESGGGEMGMAEEMLDNGDLSVGFQEMSGKTVAKAMDAARSRELGAAEGAVEEVLTGTFGHGLIGKNTRKEERPFELELSVVGAKNGQERL